MKRILWYWTPLTSLSFRPSIVPFCKWGGQNVKIIRQCSARNEEPIIEAFPHEISSYFPEISEPGHAYLRHEGIKIASPIQAACWSKDGESVCLHSPTGSGKSLAMMLPALRTSRLLSATEELTRAVLVLAPSREVVFQHANLARGLLGIAPKNKHVLEVTTAITGDEEQLETVALEIMEAKVIVATPRELALVFEHEPPLYGNLPERISALIVDEVDQLIPSRKYKGDKVTRWQDLGRYPAEAIIKLIARRGDLHQVLAGSATLDRVAKTKLEAQLKQKSANQTKIVLPLRVLSTTQLAFKFENDLENDMDLDKKEESILASDHGTLSMTTKTKIRDAVRPTIRTTLVPAHIRHRCLNLPHKANDQIFVESLRKCIGSRRPRAALILICSASGLKLRQLDTKLRTTGEPRYRPLVLTDILFPSSSRAKKRRAYRNEKGLKQRIGNNTDIATALKQGTRDKPCLVLADQAIARGLHLDDLDTVFVLGQPANADTYLHLAGRTGRDLIRRDASRESEKDKERLTPTVITIGDPKALSTLRSWLSTIATTELKDFDEAEDLL